MKIDILTIFPEMFNEFLTTSIIKRAINKQLVEINVVNFRNYTDNKHNKVDDYAFGGGAGMVLMPQPIYDCVDALRQENSKIILLSPQGKTYNQKMAYDLSKEKHVIIICGHYEGFDERIRALADIEISIGDFILTGGELASQVIVDSVVRLIDGAIEKESHEKDSFNNDLLDYPVYTKPVDFRGMKVPDVLLSGNHAEIEKWRNEKALEKTQRNRPDLLEKR